MEIVCFDMEGTLTPEIWEQVAKILVLMSLIRQLETFQVMES